MFFRSLEKLRFGDGRVRDWSTWFLSVFSSKTPYPPAFFSCTGICARFGVGFGVGSRMVGTIFWMLNLSTFLGDCLIPVEFARASRVVGGECV